MTEVTARKYDVGGVLYDRPFKIRRLNHFGISVDNTGESLTFYRDLLGFQVADVLDTAKYDPGPWLDGVPDTNIYFLRHNSDHHTFVIMPRPWAEHAEQPPRPDITINQLTWQVGNLREVVEARKWLDSLGQKIDRYGRDPGSNWHTYFPDPVGHCNELEYGIEQVGWDGLSKPDKMWPWIQGHPDLPYKAEATELADAVKEGIDLTSGYRWIDESEKKYDVGGILMGRPFKIVRIGPASLFVEDIDSAVEFYTERLGLTVTEESEAHGHRVVFLRANTEHHSLTLLPMELREALVSVRTARCCPSGYRSAATSNCVPPRISWRRRASSSWNCRRKFPRHRLRACMRSHPTARHPAVLLHGADRLGPEAALSRTAPQGRNQDLARDAGTCI